MESVHEGKKRFKCEACEYSTSRGNDMSRHVERIHKGKRQFNSDKSLELSTMIQDVTVVHREKKLFQCDNCYYSSSKKCDFQRHVEAVHERKQPFKCELCLKAFSRKFSLKGHVEAVHKR